MGAMGAGGVECVDGAECARRKEEGKNTHKVGSCSESLGVVAWAGAASITDNHRETERERETDRQTDRQTADRRMGGSGKQTDR